MAENPNIQTQVKELTDRLETGMQDLFTSDKYMDYLKTMSKFHNYSTNNTLLIYIQMPHASKVAGFNAWREKFERHVKKGEKGIRIYAPTPYKKKQEMDKLDPDTGVPLIGRDGKIVTEEVEITVPKFKLVPVFDVSQTDGKPLPNLVEDLTGDVERYELFIEALRQVSPLPIRFESMNEGVDGVCRYGDCIAIREGMSEIQTVSAVIHEIGHAVLHDGNKQQELDAAPVKRKDKATLEVEAESMSYVVCQRYGIETAANSFGYLAHWSSGRDMTELKASLDTIRKTAATLIDGIDERLAELSKKRGIDLMSDQTVKFSAQETQSSTPESGQWVKAEQPPATKPWDGLLNDKTFMLGRSMIQKAHDLIDIVEQKSTHFGYRERNLIVNYAYHTEDLNKVINLIDELAERRFELQNGYADFNVVNHINDEIDALQSDMKLNPFSPDPTISISERDAFGYTYEGMLPLLDERALELFDQDHTIYLLYEDNTEAMAFEREEIENHNGIFGIETEEWANIMDFEQMKQRNENSEATKEALLIFGKDDTFGIYQLKSGDKTRDYRFERFDSLAERGLSVDRGNYQLVYTSPLSEKDTLDSIYQRFNTDHPADFTGHSLSVSDIIVTQKGGNIESNYVDSFGFKVLSSFLGEEKTAHPVQQEQSIPAVAELELQAQSGQPISLMDLAQAVKNEQKPSSSKEKPSILAKLHDGKKPPTQGKETGQSSPKRDNNREV